jgi:transcriptional regulator GlxA family with amidase domain
MHRIAVLLLPPVVGFDAAIAPTMFSNAADADGNPLYDVVTCALTPAPVASTTGFAIVPAAGPEALATADTVVIPGTRYPPARIDGVLAPEASDALARIRPGTRLVSICTGAFVLAAAGLLDGRPATTHWKFADSMRRLHPQVLLDENVLFVDDGDVLTSAGLAAGIDLCLHIIRSPGIAWCRRGERVGRLSSSTGRCLRRIISPPPRRASGRCSASTTSSRCSGWPATHE